MKLAINKKEEPPIEPPADKKPVVNIKPLSSGAKIDKSVKIFTIKGTASIENGKITKVQIKIDSGEWTDAEGTTDWSFEWDLTDVKKGKHTISARAFDGESFSEIETIDVDVVGEKEDDDGFPGFGFITFAFAVALVLILRKREKVKLSRE